MKTTLSDVCNIIAGYAFKGKDFNSDGYPVIKITDIQPPYASTISCSHVNLSSYDTSKLTKYLVSRNDFVIAMTGATIGKSVVSHQDKHILINVLQNLKSMILQPKHLFTNCYCLIVLQHTSIATLIVKVLNPISAQEVLDDLNLTFQQKTNNAT